MNIRNVLLLTVIIILSSHVLISQKVQVAFDTLNKIEVITPEIDKELNYFNLYSDFREARLFLNPDSSYTIVIHYAVSGKEKTNEIQMSQEDFGHFRHRLLSTLKFQRDDESRNHRSSFLLGSAALGGFIWAPSLLGAIDIESGVSSTSLYLLALGGSYLVPYLATHGQEVSKGSSTLAIGGGLLGATHGILSYGLYSGIDDMFETEDSGLPLMIFSMSIAEYLGGYFYAKSMNLSGGQSSMMVNNAFLFCGHGFGLGGMLGLFDDTRNGGFGLALAGSLAGVYIGNLLSNDGSYTSGDAGIYTNIALLGAFTGLTTVVTTEMILEDSKPAIGIIMLSTAAGQVYAHYLLKDYDFTENHATYTSLGTVGGLLIGAAIGVLTEDAKVTMVMSNIGALAGFAIVFSSIKDDAKKIDIVENIEFDFNPSAFFTYNNIEFNPMKHKSAKIATIRIKL